MKKFLLLLMLLPALAWAQSPVLTQPYGVRNTIASGTIATTNTFQAIWTASTNNRGRAGCTLQNNSARTQYIYFGPIASATTPTSIQLAAGQSLTCTSGGVVAQDSVSIAGTSGDAFYAAQQ